MCICSYARNSLSLHEYIHVDDVRCLRSDHLIFILVGERCFEKLKQRKKERKVERLKEYWSSEVKVHFNSGANHNLSVYTLNNMCGGFLHQVIADIFLCKNGFRTIFHCKLSKFSFFVLRPCHAQSMKIFGQTKIQTNDQCEFMSIKIHYS